MTRALRVLFLSCLSALPAAIAGAQTVESVFPLEPRDRATVGRKPYLKIGVEGTDLPKMRFRIELSRDDFRTVSHTFDQLAESNGWAFTALGGEAGALYMTRQPLENGPHWWRVSAWNGVDWVPGNEVRRFDVDAIPPADVTGIDMRVDHEGKSVHLRWDPVTTDRDGRPETVTQYHIYRYAKKTMFFVIRPYRIATVDRTWFEDRDREALESPILFYKITAEDEAGNEPDRRY